MKERTVTGTEQELMQSKKYDQVNVSPMYTKTAIDAWYEWDTWLLNQCKCVRLDITCEWKQWLCFLLQGKDYADLRLHDGMIEDRDTVDGTWNFRKFSFQSSNKNVWKFFSFLSLLTPIFDLFPRLTSVSPCTRKFALYDFQAYATHRFQEVLNGTCWKICRSWIASTV